jgi:hypothetical protein
MLGYETRVRQIERVFSMLAGGVEPDAEEPLSSLGVALACGRRENWFH